MKKTFLSLFLLLSSIFTFVIYINFNARKNEHLDKVTLEYKKAFHAVYMSKKELSEVILQTLLDLGNIQRRLNNIEKHPANMQDYIRSVTYKELLPKFYKLKSVGIEEVQISLPNNKSFLKMSSPKFFGEDLSNSRPSMAYVNKHKLPVDSFERGKKRFVLSFIYPIFLEDKYVGNIDISFSAISFTSKLMNEYNVLSSFFIKKTNPGFSLENTEYKASRYDDYYVDHELINQLESITDNQINKLMPIKENSKKIKQIGSGKISSSIYLDKFESIVTVVPIISRTTNEGIAFLTIRSEDRLVKASKVFTYLLILGINVILLLIFYIYYVLSSRGRLFKTMVHSSSDEIFILDLDGNLIDCSKKAAKMLGYSMGEMKKLNISDWDKTMSQEKFKEFASTLNGDSINLERIYSRKDNTTYDAEISTNLLEVGGKKVVYESVRDISEKNRLYSILDYEKNKYQNILELSSEGIHIMDKEGKLIEFSQTFAYNLGYSPEELKKMRVYDWDVGIPKEDIKNTILNIIDARKKFKLFETKHKRKDGTILYVQIAAKGIEIEGKKYLYASQRDITELKNKEKEISAINKQQKSLLSLFEKGDAVLFKWRNDEKWSIEYVSLNAGNLLGYTKDEFLNSEILYTDCIHPDDIGKVVEELRFSISFEEGFFKHTPYRVTTKSGDIKWILNYTVTEKNSKGEVEFFIGYLIDISEHENLMSNLEKFVDAQENIIILKGEKDISYANKRFFDFFGYKNLDSFRKNYKCICQLFIENDKFFHLGKLENPRSWVEEIQKLPDNKRIVSMMSKDFQIHAFFVNINEFDKNLTIATFTDITQTMLAQIELEEKVIHDKLTGAFNREYFEKNYKELVEKYEQNGYFALAFIDIDHFKKVNDTFGHDVGDEVLISFVETINRFSRHNDVLMRWGGEEFILLLKITSKENLIKPLEKIREMIESQKFDIAGNLTCSIGATIHLKDENIDNTIKRADEAVYEAKARGRNQVVIKY